MMLRALQVLLITTGILIGLTAVADPPWRGDSGQGYYQEDDSGQGYRHDRDWHHHHRRRDRDREDRQDRAEADDDDRGGYRDRRGPPPWAPAYGYRRNHQDDRRDGEDDHDRYADRDVDRDRTDVQFRATTARIGISSGQCNRQAVGTVVGGIVGGIIGHNVIHTRDNNLGTVAGVLIGAVVGNQIGRNMDSADANCTNQVLERAPDGQVVRWKNPDSGYQYSITPYKTYQRPDGRYCRDYTAEVKSNEIHKYREVACRSNTGVWERQ